jgi:hypothetical protein
MRKERDMAPAGQAANPKPDHDAELFFELDGPACRLMRRIGIIQGSGPSVGRRSVAFILVMWVPMALLAVADGQAIRPTPRTSLLLDFATYARFFLAVPLIFAAEAVVGPRIREAGLRFLRAGIVRPASYWQFSAAVARVQRRRESLVAEIAFAVIAIGSAWSVSLEQVVGLGAESWHTVSMVGGRT